MTESRREAEIQRIAYQLWVLARMPKGGPERFREEAENLVTKHEQRDREKQDRPDAT